MRTQRGAVLAPVTADGACIRDAVYRTRLLLAELLRASAPRAAFTRVHTGAPSCSAVPGVLLQRCHTRSPAQACMARSTAMQAGSGTLGTEL